MRFTGRPGKTGTHGRARALPLLASASLLAGCAAVVPARMSLPAELAGASQAVEVRGLGAGERGELPVMGRTLSFRRGATRLSLFDALARTDRATLQFRWGDGDASSIRAECHAQRRTHGVGVIEVVGRPLAIECRFEPDGGRMSLVETQASKFTLRSERRGELALRDDAWTVRSIHTPQGAVLDVGSPLGYVIESGGRAFAAVERQGTHALLHLPVGDDARRLRVIPMLLALALMWDAGDA